MARIAKLADGTQLKFPDDTPDEVMDATVQRHMASAAPTPPPTSGKSVMAPPTSFADDAIDFAKNVGTGSLESLVNIGRTVTKPIQALSPDFKEYMDRSGAIAKEYNKNSGIGGFIGGAATDIAGTAGFGGPLMKGAQKLGSLLPRAAKLFTNPASVAATEGAVSGAYLSPDDAGKGAAWGAGGGAVGQQILSRTLGRIATPTRGLTHNSDAQALYDAGVPLTMGMAADPNTMGGKALRWLEESATIVPGFGGMVKAQREAARQAFRDVPLNEVAKTAGVSPAVRAVGKTAKEMQDEVSANIGAKYDALLAGKRIRPTQVLEQRIDAAINNPKLAITDGDRQLLRGVVEAHIFDKMRANGGQVLNQAMDVPILFKAQSSLRTKGYAFKKSPDAAVADKGQAFLDAADEIMNFIERRFPKQGAELQALRAPYTELNTLRKAAAKEAGARGEFSPAQLGSVALKRNDHGMQHWASMAEPLITKDPGAISNMVRAGTIAGGGLLSGLGLGTAIPAVGAATALFGTKTGQKFGLGQHEWQKRMAALLADNPELVNYLSGAAGREIAIQNN